MAHKPAVRHAASPQNNTKISLAELGLVLFVFFALLLVIVALSQALSAFHSIRHAAHEGRRPTITHMATRDFPLANSRSAISFRTETRAS